MLGEVGCGVVPRMAARCVAVRVHGKVHMSRRFSFTISDAQEAVYQHAIYVLTLHMPATDFPLSPNTMTPTNPVAATPNCSPFISIVSIFPYKSTVHRSPSMSWYRLPCTQSFSHTQRLPLHRLHSTTSTTAKTPALPTNATATALLTIS